MVNRNSALNGHYNAGQYGIITDGKAGVILQEVADLTLSQIVTWTNTLEQVAQIAAQTAGCDKAPAPNKAQVGKHATLVRIEPLKWWIIGATAPVIDAEQGSSLDLSHSRTHIRITGKKAAEFLNRHLSFDLRENAFPVGAVGSTAIHHVGVTLWHSEAGYELFIPRGFALCLWEGFTESATQFGLEIL